MAVGQDDIVVAEHGELAVLGGSVDGDVLAKHIAVAHAQARTSAPKFQIVRLGADGRIRKHLALPPEHGVAFDRGMMVHDRTVADHRCAAKIGEGADDDIGPEPDLRFDDGGGMDLGNHAPFTPSDLRQPP